MSNVTQSDQGRLCLRNLGLTGYTVRDGHRSGNKLGPTFVCVKKLTEIYRCVRQKETHT